MSPFLDLTRAEEQLMLVLWERGPSFAKEVRAALPGSLAYTTVSTILRILVQKGAATAEEMGRSHRYAAAIGHDDYRQGLLVDTYFANDFGQLLGSWVQAEHLDAAQLGALVGQAYQQLSSQHVEK
jgi:BlaI family penicillinase repressor